MAQRRRLALPLPFSAIGRRLLRGALQAKEGPSIPMRPGDGAGDGAKARIGLSTPGEALIQHEHLVDLAVPFAEELRAFAEPGSPRLGSSVGRTIGFLQKPERLGV